MAKKAGAKKQTEDEILRAAMERVQQQEGDETETETEAETATQAKEPAAPQASVQRSKKPAQAVKVAYTPLEAEDPSFTIFFGMKFSANVERDVTNPELIALARQNPWFKVDGKQGPKRARPAPREDDGLSARSGLPDGMKVENEVEVEDVV